MVLLTALVKAVMRKGDMRMRKTDRRPTSWVEPPAQVYPAAQTSQVATAVEQEVEVVALEK